MMPYGDSRYKCSFPIDSDVDCFTVCEGKCAKPYHNTCIGLNETIPSTMSGNVLWICDGCYSDLCRYRERKPTENATCIDTAKSVEEEIKDLKSAVADIASSLAKFTQKSAPCIPHCSSPISSPKLLDGTNESLNNRNDNGRIESSPPPSRMDTDCFSLYLTHIHNSATEKDISLMVSRSLGAPLANCEKVAKLVPNWKETNTLEYISFKLDLEKQWKDVALFPSTWPKGVRFREFFDRSSETWKPN